VEYVEEEGALIIQMEDSFEIRPHHYHTKIRGHPAENTARLRSTLRNKNEHTREQCNLD